MVLKLKAALPLHAEHVSWFLQKHQTLRKVLTVGTIVVPKANNLPRRRRNRRI